MCEGVCYRCGGTRDTKHRACTSCREKENDTARARDEQHPEQAKLTQRRNVYYRYGITLAEYQRMCQEQDNRCAICGVRQEGVLHVDHCHSTGKVRGLLCKNCNTGLGMFNDDETRILRAMEYLHNGRVESCT